MRLALHGLLADTRWFARYRGTARAPCNSDAWEGWIVEPHNSTVAPMTVRRDRFLALLVALLASFSTLPLFQPYFFASSDGLFHLYRLMEYDVVLRDGVWYPRWAPDFFFGLGMPLFNFYAPLTYYLAEIFRLLGAGYVDSLRLFVALVMVFSGLGAYLYARTLLSPLSSLLAAVVYMYVPYHITNLYYRGDFPEYTAYTWYPFILWAMARLVQTGSLGYLLAGSAFYAALILTHNLSAFIFSGFLLVYAVALLLREHSARRWRDALASAARLAAMALLAVVLTTFFWLPALAEKSLVNFDRLLFHFNFYEFFPTVEELFSTDLIHRYGVVFRSAEVYGYRLGVLQAVFLVVGLVLLVWQRRRFAVGLRIELVASLLVAAISFYFIFPISTWMWENAPLLDLTQFPWRFLAFIGLPSALFAGSVVELLRGSLRWAAVVVLVPIVVVSSAAGMFPIMSNVKEADVSPRGSIEFELTYGAIGTSAAAEYLPLWVKERPSISPIALATILGEEVSALAGRTDPGMEAVILEKRANRARYQVRASKPGAFVPNTLYYPGWVAFVDGKQVSTSVDEPVGLIRIQVPEGDHVVDLRFVETPLRLASDLVSAFGLLVSLVLLAVHFTKGRWATARPSTGAATGTRAPAPSSTTATPGKRAPAVGFRFPALDREVAVKIGIVVALVPAWFLARWLYDSAYSPPRLHRFPLVINMDNRVLIEGYDLSADEPTSGTATRVAPGSSLRVSVFWRLLDGDPARRLRPFIRLTNNFNQTWAFAESEKEYPQVDSKPGSAIATVLDLTVPPATPPGIYQIEVGFEAGHNQLLDVRRVQVVPILPGEKGGRIGPIIVGRNASPDRSFAGLEQPGLLKEPANFDDKLRLLAVSVADGQALESGRPGAPLKRDSPSSPWEVHAGEIVHLDLLWQAVRKLDDDFTITARLAGPIAHGQSQREGPGADLALWAVRDSQPADGTYPTSYWASGEIVRDQLNLKIPPETPPGRYELQLEAISHAGPLSVLDRNHAPAGPTLRIGQLSVSSSATPADSRKVKVERAVDVRVLEGFSIAGYSLGRKELQPGEQLKMDIIWSAARKVAGDYLIQIGLVDKTGKLWASRSGRPVGDAFPTTAWRPGETLRGKYTLTLEASVPEGEADLRIELLDAASGQSLARLSLDKVRILPRTRTFASVPSRSLVKTFEDRIRLTGYDLAVGERQFADQVPQAKAGDVLSVALHWQAVSEMSVNYTVFAQVLNASGRLVAQDDSPPQQGKAPTTAWVRDEVVVDRHDVRLPADIPPGDYTIITGIYDAATGKRLAVQGGGDFVAISALKVLSGGAP